MFYHLSSRDNLWKFIRGLFFFRNTIKCHILGQNDRQELAVFLVHRVQEEMHMQVFEWIIWISVGPSLYIFEHLDSLHSTHSPFDLGKKNWRNLMIIYVLFSKRWRKNMVFYFWKMWAIFSRTTHILSGGVGQVCL